MILTGAHMLTIFLGVALVLLALLALVLFSISEDWQAEYCEGKFHN